MNQQQRVLNMLAKLSKTPAQARRVQFALADDLREAYENARVTGGELVRGVDSAYEEVANLIGQIPDPETFMQDLDLIENRLDEVILRTESAAEALGVNAEDVSGYAEAKSYMDVEIPNLRETMRAYQNDIAPILKVGGF